MVQLSRLASVLGGFVGPVLPAVAARPDARRCVRCDQVVAVGG